MSIIIYACPLQACNEMARRTILNVKCKLKRKKDIFKDKGWVGMNGCHSLMLRTNGKNQQHYLISILDTIYQFFGTKNEIQFQW